jgi:hypothetical protein
VHEERRHVVACGHLQKHVPHVHLDADEVVHSGDTDSSMKRRAS